MQQCHSADLQRSCEKLYALNVQSVLYFSVPQIGYRKPDQEINVSSVHKRTEGRNLS
jgi:hypothetical protein